MEINKRGITLIALIITVIILLILVGTAISIAINGGDIFNKASTARESWNGAVAQEETAVKNVVDYMTMDIPEDIKVGDIVNWTPTGHYTWDKDLYASSDSDDVVTYTSGESDSSRDYVIATKELYSGEITRTVENIATAWTAGDNLDFTIDEWRVVSIDKIKKEVRLVPKKVGTPVILQGAQGYNNGVKLLNDACKALYGGNTFGIEVHNINLDDLEGTNTRDGLMKTEIAADLITTAKNTTPAYGETYKDNTGYTTYRDATGAYIEHVEYPTIYAEEALRKITNIDNTFNNSTVGLGLSEERSSFITRGNDKVTKETANEIVTKAVKTIQPAKTIYRLMNADFNSALGESSGEGTGIAELILPDGANTYYWIASRCIEPIFSHSCFGIRVTFKRRIRCVFYFIF